MSFFLFLDVGDMYFERREACDVEMPGSKTTHGTENKYVMVRIRPCWTVSAPNRAKTGDK